MGCTPSSGLPRASLKPPAQEVPHGGELGFQQAAEEAVLSTVPRCVWKSHPRGGVWICVWLCCRGMNGNGRQAAAPLYSAANGCHRQGGQLLLQSALLCQVNTLWRPRTPWPHREAPLSLQALLLPARAPGSPGSLGWKTAPPKDNSGLGREPWWSRCPRAQLREPHTLPLFVKVTINTKQQHPNTQSAPQRAGWDASFPDTCSPHEAVPALSRLQCLPYACFFT